MLLKREGRNGAGVSTAGQVVSYLLEKVLERVRLGAVTYPRAGLLLAFYIWRQVEIIFAHGDKMQDIVACQPNRLPPWSLALTLWCGCFFIVASHATAEGVALVSGRMVPGDLCHVRLGACAAVVPNFLAVLVLLDY